jgi:hypothetical protein
MNLSQLILEGRYDSITRQLSSTVIHIVKQSYAAVNNKTGKFAGVKIYFQPGETRPDIQDADNFSNVYFSEIENSSIPLDFYFELRIQWTADVEYFNIGADVYNSDKQDSEAPPLIELRLIMNPDAYPNLLSTLTHDVGDAIRHEIEHMTQSGWNLKPNKFIHSDQRLRKNIEMGKLPPAKYFTLPKEIDAMIQGLYYKAKKSKKPLSDVVDEYLSIYTADNTITQQEKEHIINTWRSQLKRLGIRQNL